MSSNYIRLYLTGHQPSYTDPSNNSITINAAGDSTQANLEDSCFITPVRGHSGFTNTLWYNPATAEIVYAPDSGGGGGSGTDLWTFTGEHEGAGGRNFFGPSGNSIAAAPVEITGTNNIACGYNAGAALVSGMGNIAIGSEALKVYTGTGNPDRNIALGHMAMLGTTGAPIYNIAIGFEAMGLASGAGQHASYNIAIGAWALAKVKEGDGNIAIGTNAMKENTEGLYNVAVGQNAMRQVVGGVNAARNVAVGRRALMYGEDVQKNTAVGCEALYSGGGPGCVDNTALGYEALKGPASSDAIAQNTAVGAYSMRWNGGTRNVAVGVEALANKGDLASFATENNVAIGYEAAWYTTGNMNVAVGAVALKMNEGGEKNVAVGEAALHSNTTGTQNVAVGYQAMYNNGAKTGGVAVGYAACNVANGGGNTALGYQAMMACTGTNNVAIGQVALGGAGTTTSGAIVIGTLACATAGIDKNNFIVIDAQAVGGLVPAEDDSCYIAPLRMNVLPQPMPGGTGYMWYDESSKEVQYDTTSKTFIIPHPNEAGKMLRHACIEAPTRGTNIYEFQVTIAKANVITKIALPTYFAKLNGRARVYVSAVNVFSHCYGAVDKTSTNVVIQNEKAGTFNVMVTGVRKDPGAVKYSATENIDDPISPENIPPSQTVIASGCVNANLIGSYLTKFKCGDEEKRKKAKNWGSKDTKLGQYD